MKWLRTLVIFDKGGIVHSSNWQAIHKSGYIRISPPPKPSDSLAA